MITQNQGDKIFEELIGLYLKQSPIGKPHNRNLPHLDEDILSAFVEGALTKRQATPIIRHLIDCVFCRRVTVQLAELGENFDDTQQILNYVKTNSWHQMWNNLTESVSRTHENAVTAHEAEREAIQNKEDESNSI